MLLCLQVNNAGGCMLIVAVSVSQQLAMSSPFEQHAECPCASDSSAVSHVPLVLLLPSPAPFVQAL